MNTGRIRRVAVGDESDLLIRLCTVRIASIMAVTACCVSLLSATW